MVWSALWPSYLAGFLTHTVAVAVTAVDAFGGDSELPWGIIGALTAVLCFHTGVGFALGALLRPVVGIALALVASYSWLGFTGVVDWFPLRHLAGLVLETCCFYDEQVDARSVIAVTIFSLLASAGLLISGTMALRLDRASRPLLLSVAGALIVAAFVGGLVVARPLTSTAAEPRDAAALECAGQPVQVCLYPEQIITSDPRPLVAEMISTLRDEGIALPTKVVAGRSTSDPDVLPFRYVPGMNDVSIASSLASSVQGELDLNCEDEVAERTIARQDASDTARAWLMLQMGSTVDASAAESLPTDLPLLASLLRAEPAAQVQFVNAAIASMRDCAVDPPTTS